MVNSVVEIRQDQQRIFSSTNNGGTSPLFVPRVGEYVFGKKVIKVEYDFDTYQSKAIVYIE